MCFFYLNNFSIAMRFSRRNKARSVSTPSRQPRVFCLFIFARASVAMPVSIFVPFALFVVQSMCVSFSRPILPVFIHHSKECRPLTNMHEPDRGSTTPSLGGWFRGSILLRICEKCYRWCKLSTVAFSSVDRLLSASGWYFSRKWRHFFVNSKNIL